MRIVTLVLVALLALVHAELWFGKGGAPRMADLSARLRAQQAWRRDSAKKRNNGVTAIDAARHEMCPEWLPCPLVALRASSREL